MTSPPLHKDLIIVLPGDNITRHVLCSHPESNEETHQRPVTSTSYTTKLGPGIRFDGLNGQYYATCAGRLEQRRKNNSSGSVIITTYILQTIQKRYRPFLEDRVIGIIEDRAGSDGSGGDLYRVNIQASHSAILSNLSFEGASKRNKPSFHPGQILYARIIPSPAATEHLIVDGTAKYHIPTDVYYDPITLSCTNGPHDTNISRKDWMTSEGAYGELRGGTLCRISLPLCRELLSAHCVVLDELSQYKQLQFEIAVGVNGLLWIHSVRPEYTILIQNAIQNSGVMTPGQVRSMVKSLVYTVEKKIQKEQDAAIL